MVTRLLVDAAHPEETRVVVVDGTRVEAFDFETSTKKQLKGNIYLAKVMRVEPSLQAAFVDFGGNRHGFLSFGDIHPDYYQIPIEDREALLKERAAEEAARGKAEDEAAEGGAAEGDELDAAPPEEGDEDGEDFDDGEGAAPVEAPESVGGDELGDVSYLRAGMRRYRIQEVIKRRQVLLVQVVKEERGTKGAALTTYLSLAGRYCVLMPNTARGGGVSRKISVTADRKRLRAVIDSLAVPAGMGLIVRTAGQSRTKTDIRRDYDYLMRVWEGVRELTLASVAPTPVYEEANLIKRAIRDLYSNDIPEVLVEGEQGFKAAKAIMKMLMPSHAKRVKQYTDRVPLFHRYQVEGQLDQMHSPSVQLKSGGYIVINPTEALVAIDVNSGRATRERSIEATAHKTNLEASEEVARQLSLRDLAGLIVIDYIDMDQARNNRSVERRLKESLKGDRARVQLGRISSFGLLELSRQRLRPSLLEASTDTCATCGGIGLVRSTESAAFHALRVIEDEGVQGAAALTVALPPAVAIYLLNQKREALTNMELRFGLTISIEPDAELVPPKHRLERAALPDAKPSAALRAAVEPPAAEAPAAKAAEPARKPGRGRGRRKPEAKESEKAEEVKAEELAEVATAAPGSPPKGEDETEEKPKRRRRGRRGGGRRRRKEAPESVEAATTEAVAEAEPAKEPVITEAPADDAVAAEAAPARKRTPAGGKPAARKPATRVRKPRAKAAATESEKQRQAPAGVEAAAASEPDAAEPGAEAGADEAHKPRRRRPRQRKTDGQAQADTKAKPDAGPAAQESPEPKIAAVPAPPAKREKAAKPRRGWWQASG